MSVTEELREPAVGSAVRLLPVLDGPERRGVLSDWAASPGGLVATAHVEVSAQDAAGLGGQRVWARVTSGDDSITVLEAVASGGARATELVLTGVLALAFETRRRSPRVETARRVDVGAASGQTLDLSSGGARVELPAGAALPVVGDGGLEVSVDVAGEEAAASGGGAVATRAEVVRVDADRHEVAVRFVDLSVEDAARIDRVVLMELSHQQSTAAD